MFGFLRHLFRGFALAILCALTIPVAVFACVVGGFVFLPLPAHLPEAREALLSQGSHIYDIDGNEIAVLQKFDQNIPVKKEDIPQILKQATVSSEDRNFYTHSGVDPRGTFRALWADLRNNKTVQGGSTITQQYVKLAYVGRERTISRKVREAILAGQLDRQVEKDEILYKYLSLVYLGDGAYGVGAASESYFRKPVSQLTASEAAALVGVIPAPSARSLRKNIATAEDHRKLVLGQMKDEGYLTQQQYDQEMTKVLWLDSQGPPPGPATVVYGLQKTQYKFPYFVDYVERYLKLKYGDDKVYSGGLRIQSTLSPKLQTEAEAAISNTLNGTSAPLEMAMVSVEPQTGFVKSLVGGRDYAKAKVNLALGGCPPRPVNANKQPIKVQVEPTCWSENVVKGGGTGRQPGSSFKPFVLASAYEVGIEPSTFYAAPPSWSAPGCTGPSCAIHNFEGESGAGDLKNAMKHSLNTVFAPLILDVGKKENGNILTGFTHTAEMAKKLGVTSAYYAEDFHRTGGHYALGVIDVSPLDMAAAYGVFANRGVRVPATPIVKIVDPNGKVLEDNSNRQGERVLTESVADNVTDALRGVVTGGTGGAAKAVGRPLAGKTGTGEDYTNSWFVGYAPTLSTSIWMGYSDSPRTINYKGNTRVTGGTVPTQTWTAYMKKALEGVPVTDFSEPAPIVSPVRDVFSLSGPDGPQPLLPQTKRPLDQASSGDFDRTDSGPPPVTPPTTEPTTTTTLLQLRTN